MEETKLIATRVECFDYIDDQNYGSRPYAVVLDVHNMEGDFIESGTIGLTSKRKEKQKNLLTNTIKTNRDEKEINKSNRKKDTEARVIQQDWNVC